ncbi:MAG: NADH-quinone oxidoreductase subunit L [Hyphomicrobiales bacterium]|nr:NADH-quinone oxidoreductase subunit L [Hyphomicrobiales bacterium]
MAAAIVFLPFIAALWAGLFCRRVSPAFAQFITTSLTMLSAVLAGVMFHKVVIAQQPQSVFLLEWITAGDLSVAWKLRVDSLTAVMLVVVTWVSALVHLYSVGYMSHDKHRQRFMAYLSLFTFFMLILVTADNFLQLFVGWEGVGLCSYLLIGFWYKKYSADAAAMKAFVVNRVGDFGLMLGIAAIFLLFGTLNYDEVFIRAADMADKSLHFWGMEIHALTLICILLFIGCMGKSAQLGLHTWLPDAMEGPTPVSALIHAATMVTAGVFLVARCSPLFELAPVALTLVTIVGAATCLFAATVAVTQNDIKKVIAYSTCSQLGYMFFACGVSAYSAGIFHLMTHGFFKALLFLGAGSVIHAMSNEQDMQKMGGLWKKIPFTYTMMLIGTLAITGFPLLSGYFSKDMILEATWAAGHHGNKAGAFAYWMGIIAATFTAFYSWRLIFLTFHGESRASAEVQSHVHESPKVMTIPLFLLSLGAVFAGAVAAKWLGIVHADLAFWNGSIVMLGAENVLEAAHHVPGWVKWSPFAVGMFGLALAWLCYIQFTSIPKRAARNLALLYHAMLNKWYFDELYDVIFVRPARGLGSFLWQFGDVRLIDGLGPNGFAAVSQGVGAIFRRVQSGFVYHYAFVMILAITGLLSWFLYQVVGG